MYNDRARKYRVDDSYFEQIDSERKAYWLGFITADGCIYEQKNTLRFAIAISAKDRELLDKMNIDFSSTYSVVDTFAKARGKKHPQVRLAINSKPFCQNLMAAGISIRKSLEMTKVNITENLLPHYIRGFFDGDGSIKKNGTKVTGVIFTGGYEFLMWIKQNLSSGCEIRWTEKCLMQNAKSLKCYHLGMYGQDNLNKLSHYFYDNASVYLSRKAEQIFKM